MFLMKKIDVVGSFTLLVWLFLSGEVDSFSLFLMMVLGDILTG